MNLTKYNRPVRSSLWGNIFDDFFNTSISNFTGENYITSTPSINIIEQDDKFLVEVASPGMDKKNFDVRIDNDHLIISGKKEIKDEETGDNYTRREFNYTSFERSFYLPESVDSGKVDAKYKDGILTITLDKKEESVKMPAKEIEIK